MQTLYAEIQPYITHQVEVDVPHVLYVEECGNPKGAPVLFVHGGPGAGCEPYHRQFFDPESYRIILFDQRGAGRSRPHAELEGNNTQALIADMEVIRQKLGVESWILFGGSWGSTLALAYAEAYPQHVAAMILRGIFLCRQQEVDWFYQQGASKIFPDWWQDFLQPIPEEERGDLLAAYYKRLTGDDELTRMAAAKAWSVWEGRTATLQPHRRVVDHFSNPHTALSLSRIEAHYFTHHSFLEENQLLRDAHKLKQIPTTIVQGRYDMICPLQSAWELHKALPLSDLYIIPAAGHSATEPGIVDALIKATHKMLHRIE